MSQENFITEFLTHCEEYDVELLPSFVVNFYNYHIIDLRVQLIFII